MFDILHVRDLSFFTGRGDQNIMGWSKGGPEKIGDRQSQTDEPPPPSM